MTQVGSLHDDVIHDAVLDYYGKRLATSSSDRTIKIFEIDGDQHKLIETLRGHEGPVWQVAWAHPKFGVVLASASYDGKVIIWREDESSGQWSSIATHAVHDASVNSISWAPITDGGAVLAAASSDGTVSVIAFADDGSLSSVTVRAHAGAVNAVVWAPSGGKRFASGGSDNVVRVWRFDDTANNYVEQASLQAHADWIRDLAWAPSVLPRSYLASASEDRSVIVWTQDSAAENWTKTVLQPSGSASEANTNTKFPDTVWRVSWSLSGNVLAVASGDNKITLWKENLQGTWEQAGEIDE
ncbi:WD40-repeat-containing domain protein [Lipomyces japonicus]|uniref:WD40-repeat-containing domain protein n=1 Tax=Lipomyces japonicus TaxID=56871 RepID=UPI0034CF3744